MKLQQYIDSTYLKTPEQAGISSAQNTIVVQTVIQEAINESFKLVMIRPEHVQMAKNIISSQHTSLRVGTVIDFPQGTSPIPAKIDQAHTAIAHGIDELDFVLNYTAFKNGLTHVIKQEVATLSKIALENNKIVKFIIEVAALSNDEIIRISALIKQTVIQKFKEEQYPKIFVKSSTGFYKTPQGVPNGATLTSIILMLENAYPLPIKAAGGVRTYNDAQLMIALGVQRIGTSAAKELITAQQQPPINTL